MTATDTSAIAAEVLTWLQRTRETIAQQAPLLAQEIVRYQIASSVIGLCFSGAALYSAAHVVRLVRRLMHDDDWSIGIPLGGIWAAVVALIGVLGLAIAANTLVEALFAPRLLILQTLGIAK